MGKYCDICKKHEKDVVEGIEEVRIINIVEGKWYSGHIADMCQHCREDIFCYQDKMPSDFNSKRFLDEWKHK